MTLHHVMTISKQAQTEQTEKCSFYWSSFHIFFRGTLFNLLSKTLPDRQENLSNMVK